MSLFSYILFMGSGDGVLYDFCGFWGLRSEYKSRVAVVKSSRGFAFAFTMSGRRLDCFNLIGTPLLLSLGDVFYVCNVETHDEV